MGVLKSALFADSPLAINQKLEGCATGKPSEVSTHFTLKERGDHVRRVKQALANYQKSHSKDVKTAFSVNDEYDEKFADAVGEYKASKGKELLNFAGKIDKIVGIKTIRSLDKEELARPSIDPTPVPPPKPAPQPGGRVKMITKRVFFKRETTILDEKHEPSFGKLIQDGAIALAASLLSPFSDFGTESIEGRATEFFPEDFGVNDVKETREFKQIQEAKFFAPTIVINSCTTTLVYTYNRPNPRVSFTIHITGDLENERLKDDTTTVQVERREAEKSQLLNPPRP